MEERIKQAYIDIFGKYVFSQIEKAIDEYGWYNNERNDQWLPVSHDLLSKLDFRLNNTELRPKSLSDIEEPEADVDWSELEYSGLDEPFHQEPDLHKLGCLSAFSKGYNNDSPSNTELFYDGIEAYLEGFKDGYNASQTAERMIMFGQWKAAARALYDVVSDYKERLEAGDVGEEHFKAVTRAITIYEKVLNTK